MNRLALIVLLTAWALLARATEASMIVRWQQGVNSYSSTQDVNIFSHMPDLTVNDDTLKNDIADTRPSDYLQPLLRFDDIIGTGGNRIRRGSIIVSATLTITVYNGGSGIFVHRILEPWDESSSWNSVSNGIDQLVATPDDGLGVQRHTKFVPERAIDFDVTPSLKAWVERGEKNYGWVLLAPWPKGTDSVGMWSSEHSVVSERPSLTVEFQQVPEPSSWAMWLASMAGAVSVRWIRPRRGTQRD